MNKRVTGFYFSNWSLKSPTAREMALAGFYVTAFSEEDGFTTRSPFNMKEIAGWEEGDRPLEEVAFLWFFSG